MSSQVKLKSEARRLARLLAESRLKIVFAESCTGGLVSAVLAQIPGISAHHCGSAVVYRAETKAEWLGIPDRLLKNPGPVSERVAREMAERVLLRTPEADISAAVTGHLGPDAPRELDGVVFVAVSIRRANLKQKRVRTEVKRYVFDPPVGTTGMRPGTLRLRRQRQAAWQVLDQAATVIEVKQMT